MSSKESRPYSDSKKTRTSSRTRSTTNRTTTKKKSSTTTRSTAKARTTSKARSTSSPRKKSPKVNLENTMRIRVDNDRLNDFETLDTSFLEGRINGKAGSNKKTKEKILLEKKRRTLNFGLLRRITILLILAFIMVLSLLLIVDRNNIFSFREAPKELPKQNEVVKEKIVLDDNYLFVGDNYTKALNFDDLDYHYVKVSQDNLKVTDVLENLKEKIYRYNPTIVFLELGSVDLKDGRDKEDIVSDLGKIVDGIKKSRPYAKIYVESLYPVNKDAKDYEKDSLKDSYNNEEIISINKLILNMTKEKEVSYLDMFALLKKDDKLSEDYSSNGVKLNDEGNKKVLDKIENIVG